ncbi:MAG: metallophosphoesterase family protein [Natronomonas sp.]
MRVGIISDVHANRVALQAVLADMPPVDSIVCAGDVVGYNPWPAECVDTIRDRDIPTVSGNHDRAVVAGTGFGGNAMADAGVRYARETLDDSRIRWLRSLPAERLCFDDRLKLVHGHPDDPDRYTYPRSFSASLLEDEDVLVMGHTHVQAAEHYDEGIVLNPGSVGQPRDGDPRAAYAVVDLDSGSADLRRTEYNIDRVAAAVDAADLPRATAERLYNGR